MTGYFPATYGFESDQNGIDAKNWTHDVITQTHSYIVDGYRGHKKVYELFDNAGGNPDTYTTFTNQTFGTIELWVVITLNDNPCYIDIRDKVSDNILVRLILQPGSNLIAQDNGVNNDLTKFGILGSNQWYHIRIDFRSALAGSYMGLSDDSYIVYVNGVKANNELLMNAQSSSANKLLITTGWSAASVNYYLYFDAVGYSWDPIYNIGDNLNEGLLLSFENDTTLGWIGYSLDGLANRTILGNTTLPLPANGAHNIQVFGNDSFGVVYQSELRYFTIQYTPPSGIPGYNLLIFGIVGVISVIIIIKKKKF